MDISYPPASAKRGWHMQLNTIKRIIVTYDGKNFAVDKKNWDTPVFICDVASINNDIQVFANDQAGVAMNAAYMMRTQNAVLIYEEVDKEQGQVAFKAGGKAPGKLGRTDFNDKMQAMTFWNKRDKGIYGKLQYQHLYINAAKAKGQNAAAILKALDGTGAKDAVEKLLKDSKFMLGQDTGNYVVSESGKFIFRAPP